MRVFCFQHILGPEGFHSNYYHGLGKLNLQVENVMKQLRPIVRISDDHLRAINAFITDSGDTRNFAAVEAVSRERWAGQA